MKSFMRVVRAGSPRAPGSLTSTSQSMAGGRAVMPLTGPATAMHAASVSPGEKPLSFRPARSAPKESASPVLSQMESSSSSPPSGSRPKRANLLFEPPMSAANILCGIGQL